MFCFQGTVSQDFSFRFFSWIIFPQASENPQICGLTKFVTFVDLPPVGQVCGFEICGPNIFCDLRICWPKFIAQIWEFCIFLLTNTYLKCSTSNFYQTKNSAKHTCRWLLDSFAIKGGIFFKRIINSLCLIRENLWICNLRIGSPTKFADLQFADQWKEISWLAYLRNLRICDCGWSPRICGFKKTVWPSLQIYLGAWGKLIHGKNLKSKISWHSPFKLSFACTKLFNVKTAVHAVIPSQLETISHESTERPPPPPPHTQVT